MAAQVLEALPARLDTRILFPAVRGGPIALQPWRWREWDPALCAAGVEHRTPYSMRHTFASLAIAAGVSLFELSRLMGTSPAMLDKTYGHMLPDDILTERGRRSTRSSLVDLSNVQPAPLRSDAHQEPTVYRCDTGRGVADCEAILAGCQVGRVAVWAVAVDAEQRQAVVALTQHKVDPCGKPVLNVIWPDLAFLAVKRKRERRFVSRNRIPSSREAFLLNQNHASMALLGDRVAVYPNVKPSCVRNLLARRVINGDWRLNWPQFKT